MGADGFDSALEGELQSLSLIDLIIFEDLVIAQMPLRIACN